MPSHFSGAFVMNGFASAEFDDGVGVFGVKAQHYGAEVAVELLARLGRVTVRAVADENGSGYPGFDLNWNDRDCLAAKFDVGEIDC